MSLSRTGLDIFLPDSTRVLKWFLFMRIQKLSVAACTINGLDPSNHIKSGSGKNIYSDDDSHTFDFTFDLHPSPLEAAGDLHEQLLLTIRLVPGDGEAQHHDEVLDGARPAFPDQTVF